MSNTPTKIVGLEGFGLTMVERIALENEGAGEVVPLAGHGKGAS